MKNNSSKFEVYAGNLTFFFVIPVALWVWGQRHTHRCPGCDCRQVISRYLTDHIFLELSGLCTARINDFREGKHEMRNKEF